MDWAFKVEADSVPQIMHPTRFRLHQQQPEVAMKRILLRWFQADCEGSNAVPSAQPSTDCRRVHRRPRSRVEGP